MAPHSVFAALTALMMVSTTVLSEPTSATQNFSTFTLVSRNLTTSRRFRSSRTCPLAIGAKTFYSCTSFRIRNDTLNIPAHFARGSVLAFMRYNNEIQVILPLREPETGGPQGSISDPDSDYYGPDALKLTGESRIRIGSGKTVRRKFDTIPDIPLFIYNPTAYTKISDIPLDGNETTCCNQPITVSYKIRMCKGGVCVKRSGKFKEGRLPCTTCPASQKPVSYSRTEGCTRCE